MVSANASHITAAPAGSLISNASMDVSGASWRERGRVNTLLIQSMSPAIARQPREPTTISLVRSSQIF